MAMDMAGSNNSELGAWTARSELRLVDGLYVQLARQLGARLITTDQRLARATPIAEAIS